MTKIVIQKDSPRYQVVEEGSYLVNLTDLSNDEFLSLTDNDNFNRLIDKYGKQI